MSFSGYIRLDQNLVLFKEDINQVLNQANSQGLGVQQRNNILNVLTSATNYVNNIGGLISKPLPTKKTITTEKPVVTATGQVAVEKTTTTQQVTPGGPPGTIAVLPSVTPGGQVIPPKLPLPSTLAPAKPLPPNPNVTVIPPMPEMPEPKKVTIFEGIPPMPTIPTMPKKPVLPVLPKTTTNELVFWLSQDGTKKADNTVYNVNVDAFIALKEIAGKGIKGDCQTIVNILLNNDIKIISNISTALQVNPTTEAVISKICGLATKPGISYEIRLSQTGLTALELCRKNLTALGIKP